jgi:glyoxylase-like metal-dependent hydrolase (beta-lactamase superfamily II)
MNGPSENPLLELGIHLIQTSSPYSNDWTNCYFIDGVAPTLIDTGLSSVVAYEAVRSALRSTGRKIEDIKRIILTHGHADHRALAPRIREESGAEVFCHQLEAGNVVRYSQEDQNSRDRESERIFRSLGVGEDLLPTLVQGPQTENVKPKLDSVSFLTDGEEIPFDGFQLQTLHTPGHSCGSVCLYEHNSGIVFAGDTLLPIRHITALIETEMLARDDGYNSLKLHLQSLNRLLQLSACHILPGHGPVFRDYKLIVHALQERHAKRRRHIIRSLRKGPRSVFQICRSVFPFAFEKTPYLALSEIVGNLGLLEEEGTVMKHTRDELIVYEMARK